MKATANLLAALLFVIGAVAHADEAAVETKDTETISFTVGKLADETRLVPSLMTMARQLDAQPGVEKAEVRLSKREVHVRFRPDATGLPALVSAIESLGYRAATPVEPVAEHAPERRIVVAAR